MLNIKQDLRDYLGNREDPVKLKNILKGMGLPNSDRQYLRAILTEMVKDGLVSKMGSRYWVPEGEKRSKAVKREKTRQESQVTGRLTLTPRGNGFIEVERGQDWFVPARSVHGAKHGDLVRARKQGVGGKGRIHGEVVAIETLGARTLLGVFVRDRRGFDFLPFGNYVAGDREFNWYPPEAEDGDVGLWRRKKDGTWAFAEIIGKLDDPATDEIIALRENEIETDFDPDAAAEAKEFDKNYPFQLGGREDFRDQLVFTVDGADARDFDDALHFKRISEQGVEVGIHIADVSTFVAEGSALDRWARQTGNSTYLPHKAFPMLPPILSNELCSLKPGVPRYTLSVVIHLSDEGEVRDFRMTKGLVESRFRLTYDEVAAIGLDRDPSRRAAYPDLTEAVDLALRLSRRLRKRRFEHGGLDLDLGEIALTLDEHQRLKEVRYFRQNDANRMIEAFMCLANDCVARFLTEAEIGIPYRIHEPPDPEKLLDLAAFMKASGLPVPEQRNQHPARTLNQLIPHLRKGPAGQVRQIQLLKALKLAVYSPENRGHFGLGSTHYTHFTSPIRRYADLMVHRRLSAILVHPDRGPEYFDDTSLASICTHISQKERASEKAEQSFSQMKLLRHLWNEVGEVFEGVVTEIKSYGLFVQILPWYATGLLRIEDLQDDDYEFIAERYALVGQRKRRQIRVGSLLRVQIVRVDLVQRKLDLMPAEAEKRGPKPSKSRRGTGREGRRKRAKNGRKRR